MNLKELICPRCGKLTRDQTFVLKNECFWCGNTKNNTYQNYTEVKE